MSAEMARVIRPLSISPANLVSTNVPEDDYVAWTAGTYPAETWVRHQHRVWQALKETDKEPGTPGSENDWIDGGATNRWKMFDEKVGTQTINVDGVEVVVETDDFADGVYLLNLWSNAVRVTMIDAVEGEVYEREVSTVAADVDDWWEYFFEPITRTSDVVLDDLPPYAGVEIKVEILVAEGDTARVGAVGIGSTFDIGCARWGTSVGVRDFSVKEQDEWGNVFVQERDYSKRPEFDLLIETPRVDLVMSELAKLRARPCIYIAHSKFTSTIALGFYRELMMVLSNPSVSECTLTIEGLT